ncbi:ATP-binding protein [Paraglaciecola sp. L3A3]|uniref:ATP-binding protein n=1 Tax=Paraglaciecola sp. L3A3 TaxID=2686358 RepID=UPI00131C1C5C|nr:ATP-binding protein [Paraglaciecola sp. L3A3]
MKESRTLVWTALQKKIFLLVVSLFTLVFTLTLWSIYQAAYNQAEREFVARLNVGKNVFSNEVAIAKLHLDSSVDTIAKDWALRSAIGQGHDKAFIKSVLFNHGKRIKADLALVLDKEFMLITQYGGEEVTVDQSLGKDLDDLQKTRPWIVMVGNDPFIVSAKPIKAPATIGWLLIGKKLNKEFLQRIKGLISLDINFIVSNNERDFLVLSTAENNSIVTQELLALTKGFLDKNQSEDMRIAQTEELVVMPFELWSKDQNKIVVVLQDSIRAWVKTRDAFLFELVPFFIVGILLALIGSFFIARSITRPVGRLLNAAKLVATGSYTEQIEISEKSELGELAKEFASMQSAVMEREQKIKDQAEEIRQTNTIKYQIEIAQKEQQLAATATAAKSRFLANVSHEIRTPLNSIIGFSEVLSDEKASKQDRTKAAIAIHSGGKYLLNIVNDVLDLSKIEAGKIQLENMDTSVLGLLDEVSTHMEGFALEKHLQFNLKLHFPLPFEFNTDPTRLKQILLNLCNNAIKFTEAGQVDLQVHLDTYRQRFIFVVSDTGLGMSDEEQLRLFTAFTQGNQSSSRKYGGTGLGLYISKQLTEMLGGHIKVTSQQGLGSQFAVYMPWVEAENKKMMTSQADVDVFYSQKVQPSLEVPQFEGHILCADDNEDNRQLVAYLVAKTGAKLTLVENGQQAVEIAEHTPFDLVLMDMQMPEMDGLTATELLTSQGFKAPIIMLTANVDASSKKDVLAAGAREHFSKPIDTQRFYAMLDKYLGQSLDINELELEESLPVRTEFDKLIDNYRQSFTQKLDAIQQALGKDDWQDIKRMMHNLKGSAGSYGFQVLSDLAGLVEEKIDVQEWTEAKRYLTDLQSCMEQLHQVSDT